MENRPQTGQVRLTSRELEVLQQLSRGMQNKAIAHELGISVATVKMHIKRIMAKVRANHRMKVDSRMQLMLWFANGGTDSDQGASAQL